MGKLVARIVQSRLQALVEKELPESQCGFRRGRGCTNIIYVVRQLVEKTFDRGSYRILRLGGGTAKVGIDTGGVL